MSTKSCTNISENVCLKVFTLYFIDWGICYVQYLAWTWFIECPWIYNTMAATLALNMLLLHIEVETTIEAFYFTAKLRHAAVQNYSNINVGVCAEM